MHLLNNYLVTGVLLSINISVFIVLSIFGLLIMTLRLIKTGPHNTIIPNKYFSE